MTKTEADHGQPTHFGLLADGLVRWFLDREDDVRNEIAAWVMKDVGEGMIDVAGPPTAAELIRFREEKDRLNLPTIRLHLKRSIDFKSGQAAILVTVSESDRAEILRWHNEARLRSAIVSDGHDAAAALLN